MEPSEVCEAVGSDSEAEEASRGLRRRRDMPLECRPRRARRVWDDLAGLGCAASRLRVNVVSDVSDREAVAVKYVLKIEVRSDDLAGLSRDDSLAQSMVFGVVNQGLDTVMQVAGCWQLESIFWSEINRIEH
jgi:hypothetical protein